MREDVMKIRQFVYSMPNKTKINETISHSICVQNLNTRSTQQSLKIKHNLKDDKMLLEVSKKALMSAFRLSSRNIIAIGKKRSREKLREKKLG